MKKTTSIMIHAEFKKELAALKLHPRESYQDVIKRLAEIVKSLEKSKNKRLSS